MQMKILILLFLLLPVVALSQINQTDSNGLRQGRWQKKQSNGMPMYDGYFKDDKPVGEWKRFHTNGKIKATISYKAGSDTAFTVLYEETGKKMAEGVFLNELKAGPWKYFSENKVVAEENFDKGIKNGKSRKFYSTGEVCEETDWVNGKQEGNYQVFFKNGKPFFQCKMLNNQRNGLCLSYFDNGRLELEAAYKNDLRDGEWKYYDREGKYLYSLFFDNGRLLNPQVRDSIANKQLLDMEKGKELVTDPEKYISDPSEYMQKENILK
jgi:antitoxin component YwqK of YwqJK toxin-antitoxin module